METNTQEKVSAFVDAFEAGDGDKLYREWEGSLTPDQLDAAVEVYASRDGKSAADVRHFRRFVLGEHALPIISTGPARKLTRKERLFLGPEDRDEHSED